MDTTHDSSLLAYLQQVPDPRGRRGRSFEWQYLLLVLAAAIAAGASTVRGMADWAKAREAELVARFHPPCGRVPSLSTLERVLWRIDRPALEQAIAAHAAANCPPPADDLQGLALDGKVPRGVVAHGGSLCLVSLVCHERAVVLGQAAVPEKANEQTAAYELLAQVNLTGWVVTADAMYCQRRLAQEVLDRGGDYVLAVKGNQPALLQSLVELFETPPDRRFQPVKERSASYEKGHGRWEARVLETSTLLNDYLDWPGLAQVMCRRCRRRLSKGHQEASETTWFITSLPPERADAARLARLIRGHWTIENKLHHVRDVTFREDHCTARTGSAAQALAALRNGVLNVLRCAGRTAIAQAVRWNAAYTVNALACIGAGGT